MLVACAIGAAMIAAPGIAVARDYHGEVVGRSYSVPATSLRPPPKLVSNPMSVRVLHDFPDRRSYGRTRINRGALLFFSGREGVFACTVRDVTNHGARIELSGLRIIPSEFDLSFDAFRTIRRCGLIWRRDDLVGLQFLNCDHIVR